MDPATILRERYIIGRVLGYGGFGVTYLGWDALLERKIAVKEYLPSEFSTRMPGQSQVTVFQGDKSEQYRSGLLKFVEEAQRLMKFHNMEGIVEMYDSFEENNTAYIIMEYLNGVTLGRYVRDKGPLPAEEAVRMLLPVIYSLQPVHEWGIIHRDIAPDNIFVLEDGRVKLIDFGAARYATTLHSRSLTVIIKPGYSPEEQYRSRGDQGSHTDVYSLGATLYYMTTGVVPPDAMERRAFFEGQKKDILAPVSQFNKKISPDTETAILNALNVRIEDRTPDMDTLAAELTSETAVKRRAGAIEKTDLLRWPVWARISLPAAVALVAVLTMLFYFGVIGFDSRLQSNIVLAAGMSRVPSVVSDSLEQAEERIDEAGLLFMIVGKEYSAAIPAEYILSQSVSPGTIVARNTLVDIVVSGGEETESVPNVTGLNATEAQAALEALGFVVVITEEYSDVVPAEAIISQDAAADGELALGRIINIVVSKGVDPDRAEETRPTRVPALTGLTYDAAVQAAQTAGLRVKTVYEYSDDYAKNVVMKQTPAADREAMTGDIVELVVSRSQEMVKIKDVQYRKEAEARTMLEAQGLKVSAVYEQNNKVAAGVVFATSPGPGRSVAPGSAVKLSVSKGEAGFAMPNVANQTEAEAVSALTGKGLSVAVHYEQSSNVAEGKVIRQSVAANTQVTRGTEVALTVSSGQATVTVPSVVGMSESAARSKLTTAGFKVSSSEADSDEEEGVVVSQAPAAKSAQKSGALINITVSNGSGAVTVTLPKLEGENWEQAESKLYELGINPDLIREFSSDVDKDKVISQSPSAGTKVKRDSTVTLRVSDGPATAKVTVPNVVGQTQAKAEKALSDLGLKHTEASENSTKVEAGLVISQSPSSGTKVNAGTAVALKVSLGPAVKQVAAPNVVGNPQAQAESALSSLGLSATVTSENSADVAAGLVISQSPAAGTQVNEGGVVALKVSLGPPAVKVTVPNVVGATQAQAENALGDLGLSVNITSENSAGTAAGIILTQTPSAGTKVDEGATVTLKVSLGPAAVKVTVPNVVGSTQSQAENALSNLGLSVSVTSENSDSAAAGTVISQTPAGGTKVDEGATVTLKVSLGPAVTQVTAPDVVGRTQAEAEAALTGLGLTVSVTTEHSDSVAAGTVLSQAPAAGTKVDEGTAVAIKVSLGPAPAPAPVKVTAPDVVGRTQAEAETALTGLGLTVSITTEHSDSVAAGTVISQAPAAGTQVDPGTAVALIVSLGPAAP
jgi:beta-lactam-binding protein with PASTA domain